MLGRSINKLRDIEEILRLRLLKIPYLLLIILSLLINLPITFVYGWINMKIDNTLKEINVLDLMFVEESNPIDSN